MEKRLLTRRQMNEVFDLTGLAGLDPSEFRWDVRPSKTGPALGVSEFVHAPTGYYFRFDFTRVNQFWYDRAPGFSVPRDWGEAHDWEVMVRHLKYWLHGLKLEVEAPDLWGELLQDRRLLESAASPDLANTPFGPDEIRAIGERLRQIEAHIQSTYQPTPEQHAHVQEGLDYLIESSQRLGRKDWINIGISTALNIATTVGTNAQAVGAIYHFVTGALSGLGLVPLPPGPTPGVLL